MTAFHGRSVKQDLWRDAWLAYGTLLLAISFVAG